MLLFAFQMFFRQIVALAKAAQPPLAPPEAFAEKLVRWRSEISMVSFPFLFLANEPYIEMFQALI